MANTPKLVQNNTPMSKANTTAARVAAIASTASTELSPSKVYTPTAANEVSQHGDAMTEYTWVCPPGITTVQVECIGAGGGGGGGGPTALGAGGGGGGGEYACEPDYPVVENETYSFFAGSNAWGGFPDLLGSNNAAGATGADTVWDPRGKGITGGVIAHGGQGGDQGGPGVPGTGGSGSDNAIHFDGGNGGGTGGNVFSDNPYLLLSDINNLNLWYRFDELRGPTAYDYSFNNFNSNSVYITSGGIIAPTPAAGAPSQTPIGIGDINGLPIAGANETPGVSWKFDKGSAGHGGGYVLAPSFPFGGSGFTTLTVSCWIKGSAGATSSIDWGSNIQGGAGRSVIAGNANSDSIGSGGWYMAVNGNGHATFVVETDHGVYSVTAGTGGLSATDGNWHQIVGVMHTNTASGMIIYVDGVSINTANTNDGATFIKAGPAPVAIGMDKTAAGYYWNGFISNFVVSRELYTAGDVTSAFGAGVSVGGGGGGASGGSAGKGNNGAPGSGSAGGAGGAGVGASSPITRGSGAGGTGGTGANGGGGDPPGIAPYGGGGGGSASYSETIAGMKSVDIPCLRSASYCGYDATGGFAGKLFTVSESTSIDSTSPFYAAAAQQDGIIYAGGTSDSPFDGSMNSILVFPTLASIVGGLNGATPTYLSDSTQWSPFVAYLNLTIETPNACTIFWSEWKPNTLPDHIDDTVLTAGGLSTTANGIIRVPAGEAGRRIQVPVNDFEVFAGDLQDLALNNGFGGQGIGILIGSLQGSVGFQRRADGAWDNAEAPDWYGSLHGAEDGDTGLSASLTLQYYKVGTYDTEDIVGGGAGDPGYIVVSYITPEGTPVSTVLPAAETDASGHALGAGFTADPANYNVWQPGSSPKVLETKHPATLAGLSGWTQQSGGMIVGYKLLPGNIVAVTGAVNAASGAAAGVLFTVPLAYRPAATQPLFFWPAVNGNTVADWRAFISSTDGTVNVSAAGTITTFHFNAYYHLTDV